MTRGIDSEALKALLAQTTPGPWTTFNATDVFPDDDDDSEGNNIADCDMGYNFNTHEIISNARLIALAPTLAATVIALTADNKALREAIETAARMVDESDNDLSAQLCCSGGTDCGCRGSTVRCLLMHDIRALATKPETGA